ncbi:MAG: TetR/AcrR family transcriptional regulator [Burkholderiaceae bacterium]
MTQQPASAVDTNVDSSTSSQRSEQILDQIREVFLAKGFEEASMQDLAKAAAMSVGNFYRYFPSKDAIIAALIERDLQMLESEFSQIRHASDLRKEFRASISLRMESAGCENGPMLIEIESAALRRPAIHDALCRVNAAIEKNLLGLFAQLTALSPEEAAERFSSHAQLVVTMVKGVMRENRLSGSNTGLLPTPALRELVLAQVDKLIDEVIRQAKHANLHQERNGSGNE